jgi:ferric-dicitrate binding protein FerR (iron transport regulator)
MKDRTENEKIIDRELNAILPSLADETYIDVDTAWNRVAARINEPETAVKKAEGRLLFLPLRYVKIAAAIILLAALGITAIFFKNNGSIRKQVIAATESSQQNLKITLPDGSLVTLNRNTKLEYKQSFGRNSRKVSLSGEAFFQISPDESSPFIIDAGKANVRVVGTSFNVITDNPDSSVEVFVQSGKVMLYDNSGNHDIIIEPGYVGIIGSGQAEKTINNNPNYMAWNTGKLEYDGQTLDIVFRDLKRVFNMDISVADPLILANRWTSPIDIQSRDTIIRLICTSFNLNYTKNGDIYHLYGK